MRPVPVPGELYRHFKNKMYQIVAIAQHSETKEKLVIYQALYGDYGVYARPLDMFLSEVDHEKYPEVTQLYRFEKVDKGTLPPACPPKAEDPGVEKENVPEETVPAPVTERVAQTMPERKSFIPTQPRDRSIFRKRSSGYTDKNGENAEWVPDTGIRGEGEPDPNLMAFLEAETLEQKYHILVMMRDVISDQLIDNMAASLDVMINEGDLIRRYDELKYTLRIRMKYEDGSRLRRL